MKTATVSQWARALARGDMNDELARLYPGQADFCDPYLLALEAFARAFGPERPISLMSAPGRTELGGNHTDHQRGRVLAAAVSLDMAAAVSPNAENRARILSRGMPEVNIDLRDLSPRRQEEGTSAALVRGVAAGVAAMGGAIGGFDAAVVSSIPVGAGLSSSAAYEILIGLIFNSLYCRGAIGPETLARIGHRAENEYFNKPCGMMDQTACAVGGAVAIDFYERERPVIERIDCDFTAHGYRLMLAYTDSGHADLTGEYAAIPREMRAVAEHFGQTALRDVNEEAFYRALPALRRTTGDRAVLRAMHFFDENRRVKQEADALRAGDMPAFAALMRASGASSELLLQNIWPADDGRERGVALALALSRRLLDQQGGAWRVHGGGFAGTVQALVPEAGAEAYRRAMDELLGLAGACRAVFIRPAGGYVIGGN